MLNSHEADPCCGDALSEALRSGALDHIPKDLVDRVAPALARHFERIANRPEVLDYYKRRKAA